jgi:hypothetical protein
MNMNMNMDTNSNMSMNTNSNMSMNTNSNMSMSMRRSMQEYIYIYARENDTSFYYAPLFCLV